jgi:nicotinamidase-related amidase
MNQPDATETFLLVVDMQPAFFPVLAGADAAVKRCALALETARGLGLGVGFTEQVPAKLGPTAPELLAAAQAKSAAGPAEPDAPVWRKTAFSALGEPAVSKDLRARGVRRLLLAGIETSVCIYQTAHDALQAGLEVMILADAVTARRPEDARHALAELARRGAAVLPVETVFYQLLRDANHPFFREYTKLVKKYG